MNDHQIKKQVAKKKALESAALPQKEHALNNRACLVGMVIRRWHPLKTDKEVSDEVADSHQSNRAMGRYHKRLVPKEATKKMRSIANELRREHFYLTLPWSDDGKRVLTSKGFFIYRDKMQKLIAEYNAGAREFKALYPSYIKQAETLLGPKMFKLAEFPAIDEIEGKFAVELSWSAVPTGDDIRLDVGDDELKVLRQQVEASTQVTLDNAVKDVWSRIKEVLEHASERLKAYEVDSDGKVVSTFRDSLVTNISDLLQVLPALNLHNDPQMDAFAEDIRERILSYKSVAESKGVKKTTLKPISGELLRDDGTLRNKVAEAADEILKKMEGFL